MDLISDKYLCFPCLSWHLAQNYAAGWLQCCSDKLLVATFKTKAAAKWFNFSNILPVKQMYVTQFKDKDVKCLRQTEPPRVLGPKRTQIISQKPPLLCVSPSFWFIFRFMGWICDFPECSCLPFREQLTAINFQQWSQQAKIKGIKDSFDPINPQNFKPEPWSVPNTELERLQKPTGSFIPSVYGIINWLKVLRGFSLQTTKWVWAQKLHFHLRWNLTSSWEQRWTISSNRTTDGRGAGTFRLKRSSRRRRLYSPH